VKRTRNIALLPERKVNRHKVVFNRRAGMYISTRMFVVFKVGLRGSKLEAKISAVDQSDAIPIQSTG
jgi:hypothetical protein